MTPGAHNRQFLSHITQESKQLILDSIARHYGVTSDDIWEEVTGQEAYDLLEYMVEPHRGGAMVLMQRHGFSFFASKASA